MATLVGQQLKDTYDSLLKTSDNDALGGTYKEITDGSGNGSNLYLGTGGRVGIGTNSPSKDLTINSATGGQLQFKYDTQDYLRIEADSGGGSYYAAAGLYHRFFTSGSERLLIGSGGDISFRDTGGSEAFYWDASAGSLGIGTTSPDSFLPNGRELVLGDGSASHGMTIFSDSAGTGNLFFADGTTGDQAYRGFLRYAHSSDSMEFYTAGAILRMSIDSSGNVGIGETNPLVPIHISKDSASGENIALLLDNNNTTANNEVGLLFRGSVGGQNTDFQIASINKSANNADLVFRSDGTVERMRILSGGDVSFAMEDFSASPSNTVYGLRLITGTTGKSYWKSAVNADTTHYHYEFLNTNGSVGNISTSASATAYNTSSDYRLKENVVALTGALDRVDQLNPSRFNFIADADTTVDGFLAHEVADVVPEAITGEKDAVDDEGNPIYQGIDQSKLVPLLVGAIQELRAEIEQLKNQ